MKLDAYEAVAKAFDKARVRYLVVGGLAVNAHGYLRFTADIDLVIALDPENIQQAFQALAVIGYRPIVPVDAASFSNAEQRRKWQDEKGMQVLNFYNDSFPETTVDVFVHEPFDFAAEYERAVSAELLPGIFTRYVSIPTLIRMKMVAGRPRDLDDIRHLKRLQENRHGD